MGDIKNTCQAVESYLLFYPADETMINNKMFYSKLPKIQKNLNFFRPRKASILIDLFIYFNDVLFNY